MVITVKNKYTEITSTVYKILDYFPEGEPLKVKAKEKTLEIMENLVLITLPDNPRSNPQKGEIASQVLEDIEVLKNYLSLGKSQGWIENMNLMILFKEYDGIKEEIKPIAALAEKQEKSEKIAPVDNFVQKKEETVSRNKLSNRQEEILKVLEIQNKAQVADLKRVMPNVSKRTLRRDLDDLLKKEKVIRVGEWNQVFYQIHRMSTPNNIQAKNIENSDGTVRMS